MTRYLTLVAKQFDGDLPGWLADQRCKGVGYRRIAEKLTERDLPVSYETVRQWCLRLGIERSDG